MRKWFDYTLLILTTVSLSLHFQSAFDQSGAPAWAYWVERILRYAFISFMTIQYCRMIDDRPL